jgi:ABC-type maltose transport system permease subunit
LARPPNIAGSAGDFTVVTIAAGRITITPLLVMFVVLQRYWRGGLRLGSVTG